MRTTLNNDGSILIEWDGTRAFGQNFTIFRNLGNGWEYVRSIGARKFVDKTVPLGAREVLYQVKAYRGARESAGSEIVSIWLGCKAA